MFLTAALVALSLCAVPAAMANSPTSSKALRFTVVKRTPQFDVVKGHHHRFAVGHGAHKVVLHSGERYRVVGRTHRYVVLRAVSRNATAKPTIISPNSGGFALGVSTTITWRMSAAVSTGYYRVSLKHVVNGTSTGLTASKISARRDVTSYSVPWNVTQAVGTYTLWVYYYSSAGKVIGSDVSDGALSITTAPVPTPVPTPANDPIAAIKAAKAGDTVSVAAGTFTGNVDVPDGVTVVGAAKDASWLKGHVTFGSNERISDLRIGDAGMSAVHNRNGATNTVFERCRFRGGGGRAFTYVIDLGSGAAASHITFKDSEVERNLGVESGGDQGFNDIGIWIGAGGPVSDITFDGVHVGVSNGQGGHDTGAPRFGMECYTDPGSGTSGWQNITIRNSVFEAADMETADFSDTPTARGTGLLIEGNTFKGGGYANVKWKYVLNFEMPLGVVVRNNVFQRGYGGWGSILNVTDRGNSGYTGPGAVFTGNTFDLDTENGIAAEPDAYPIVIKGSDNQFTNNTIQCHYGSNAVVLLDGAHNNTVTGNTFNIGSRSSVSATNGSSGNTISSNTVN
jgi:hypothetical protein